MKPVITDVKSVIISIMNDNGISIEELAQYLNIEPTSLHNKLVTGINQNKFTLSQLERISDYQRISDYLGYNLSIDFINENNDNDIRHCKTVSEQINEGQERICKYNDLNL